MPVIRERNDLDKKPIWFLFLAANVLVILGCAITWILIKRSAADMKYFWLPTLIANLLSIIAAGFFVWLEARDIQPKLLHFQRKWLKFYIVAMSMFVAAILFNSMYYLAFLSERIQLIQKNNTNWELIIYMVITGVLTLLAIGFQRYARFRIDLDVYRRKHGEEIKQKEDLEAQQKAADKPAEKDVKQEPEKSSEKDDKKEPEKPAENEPKNEGASGRLLDQM